jgi:hypothetical protein
MKQNATPVLSFAIEAYTSHCEELLKHMEQEVYNLEHQQETGEHDALLAKISELKTLASS